MLCVKNQTALDSQAPNTIYEELFESSMPRFAGDDAPLIIDAMDPSRFLTFTQVRSQVRALAKALRRAPFSLQEGDVIAICTPEDVESFVALYGIVCAGCTACVVRAGTEKDELDGIIQSTSPKAVIAHPKTLSTIRCAWKDDSQVPVLVIGASSASSTDELQGTVPLSTYTQAMSGDDDAMPVVDPDTSAFLLTTSGSVGLPKRVNLTQRIIAARIRHEVQVKRRFFLYEDGAAPCMLGFTDSAFGPWLTLSYLCIQMGVPQYVLDYWKGLDDVCLILRKVQEFGVTLIYYLDSQLAAQVAYQPELAERYDLSTLRVVCSRGQTIPSGAITKAANALGAIIVNFFASTETGVIFALTDTSAPYAKVGIFGQGLESSDIKIVSQNNQELPAGVEGELWVKSPMNAAGYYGRPDLTEKAFDSDGYYHTSDMFIADENGKYTVLGRQADIIKAPTLYFFPGAVEEICLSFGGIKQCAVVSALSPKYAQEFPRAYIAPTEGTTLSDEKVKELIAYVEKRVPKKEMRLDGGVKVLQELPVGRSGKINRYKLRQMAAAEVDQDQGWAD